ncbi:unnamed protein product [Lupinus luteus]|uniref:Uncharacterized protein n=1 Tax=Lupinus luteus TaxID=3873 RepID=A0AAV1W3W1_LUPLU
MLGNSYPSAGGPLSQTHVEAGSKSNSMGMLNDMNTNDSKPFDSNDFPQLTSRPSSAGGHQGQLDYAMDMHQKEQLHDNDVPMMQSQHFSMGRSADFSSGGTYSSHCAQQQQHAPSVNSGSVPFSPVNNQDLLHLEWTSRRWIKASKFCKCNFWYRFIRLVHSAISTAPEPAPVPPSNVNCKATFSGSGNEVYTSYTIYTRSIWFTWLVKCDQDE